MNGWSQNAKLLSFMSRCTVVTTSELYTNDLALELRDALGPKLGNNYPKYILNTLDRKYLDPFTDKDEATMNEPIPTQAYNDFHNAILEAIPSSTACSQALLVSLGGYSDTSSYPVTWTMLGKIFLGISVHHYCNPSRHMTSE